MPEPRGDPARAADRLPPPLRRALRRLSRWRPPRRLLLGLAGPAAALFVGFGFLFVANPCLRGDVDPGGGRGWIEVTLTPGGPAYVGMDGHVLVALDLLHPIPEDRLVATVRLRVGLVHWLKRVWQKLTGRWEVPPVLAVPAPALVDVHVFDADFPRARTASVKDRGSVLDFRVCRRDARIRAVRRDGERYTFFLEAYRD